MISNIVNPTPEAREFLSEWFDNSKDYITAHTSGTTGKPKDIHLPKRDMLVSAKATCDFFALNSMSILVSPLSASYIAGKMMIVRALLSGAKLYFEKPSSNPLTGIEYPPIDLLPIVPAQINSILQNQTVSLRNVIVGGAPMAVEQERLIAKSRFNVFATYGMTETCSHIALRKVDGCDSCFHAMPGIKFTVDDRGCLVVHARDYSFGMLTTNDVVKLCSPTSFVWMGRADNVIITGGLKVHPEELEKKISGDIDRPFYIASAKDKQWGNIIVLCLEGTSDDYVEKMLTKVLNEKLPSHERPRCFKWIPSFRYTSSGKLIREPAD